MNFFAVFLRKLEPSCEIGAYSAAILRRVLFGKWLPLALSLSQYRALFADITSTRRCGGEPFVCFAEKENSHDRKAIAVTCAEGYVVGHLPCEISGLCFHFIKLRGEINGKITGGYCVRGIALAEIERFAKL